MAALSWRMDIEPIKTPDDHHAAANAQAEKVRLFRQDTLKAWEDYRTTGLHVTADEADVWLDQLAEGIDIEPPKCHV